MLPGNLVCRPMDDDSAELDPAQGCVETRKSFSGMGAELNIVKVSLFEIGEGSTSLDTVNMCSLSFQTIRTGCCRFSEVCYGNFQWTDEQYPMGAAIERNTHATLVMHHSSERNAVHRVAGASPPIVVYEIPSFHSVASRRY